MAKPWWFATDFFVSTPKKKINKQNLQGVLLLKNSMEIPDFQQQRDMFRIISGEW